MSEPTDVPTIRAGSRVRMHLELALGNGEVVESSFGGEPFEFTLGDGTFAEPIERALRGLAQGQREQIFVPFEAAFGWPEPDLVHVLARADFADGQLEEGVILEFATPGGSTTPGRIVAIDAEQVSVDFNHPLAGHDLVLTVEVLGVRPPA